MLTERIGTHYFKGDYPMSFTKTALKTAILGATGAAAMLAAAPASAALYTYTMTNGDVLEIDSTTSSATWVGDKIDVSMTSADFATFTGGSWPRFSYVLDSLDGTRLINGVWETDNPLYADTTHPQKLIASKGSNGTKINLWAWWGDPIVGGDYIKTVGDYSAQVPEPGVLGLFGLGLAALGWRRRRKAAAA